MRKIELEIEEYGIKQVRITAYYGDKEKASELENYVANQLHPLIHESLRIVMPQCITGEGEGRTREEAQAMCDLATDIHRAAGKGGDDRPQT